MAGLLSGVIWMHLSGCIINFDATNIDFLHQGGCEVREMMYHFSKMWGQTAHIAQYVVILTEASQN